MLDFAPTAYLAAHPLEAYGAMLIASCAKPGLVFVVMWVPSALSSPTLDMHVVFAIAILGDWVNDNVFYWANRAGRGAATRLPFPQIKSSHTTWLSGFYDAYRGFLHWLGEQLVRHPALYLFIVKLPPFAFIPGTGGSTIAVVGAVRFPYRKFFPLCATLSALWTTTYYELVAHLGAPLILQLEARVKAPVLYALFVSGVALIIVLFVRNQVVPRVKAYSDRKK